MIAKIAALVFTDINPLHEEKNNGDRMMRTASGRVIIEPGSEKAKVVEGQNDFASVLKKKTESTQTSNAPPVSATSRTLHTSMVGLGLDQSVRPENAANRLLDSLENYQRMLGDPSVNLKQVQPMVDQMKAVADETAPLAEKMSEDDKVREVIEEALIQINKKIARFERGEYVD